MKVPKYDGRYDRQIRYLVEAMTYKLGVHQDKGDWDKVSLTDLVQKLRDEVDELNDSVACDDNLNGIHECGDVAAVAMMILERLLNRGVLK